MEQVVAFSTLYRTIPVIAAYDKDGEIFSRTIYRPWIFNEARLFRYNPTKIMYVGHSGRAHIIALAVPPSDSPYLGRSSGAMNLENFLDTSGLEVSSRQSSACFVAKSECLASLISSSSSHQ